MNSINNNLPWINKRSLDKSEYANLRRRAIFECFKWDPQIEDIETLAPFPIVLKKSHWEQIAGIAESLTDEILAAETELLYSPRLYHKIGLPLMINIMLRMNLRRGANHGVARVIRFDFHYTTEGWIISEANTDVPGGFNEASGISKLMLSHYPDCRLTGDPSEQIIRIISEKIGEGGTIAFIHATSYSDDRQVMEYLSSLSVQKKLRSILCAPDGLSWKDGYAYEIGEQNQRADFILRFYPAEWLPNLFFKCDWKYFFLGSKIPQSNPGSALLIQSKKLPIFWDSLKTPMPFWKKFLPQTVPASQIKKEDESSWVFKPIFGRVGDGIGIAGETEQKEMKKIKKNISKHPKYWVAQKRFTPVPFTQNGQDYYPCIGVYTIDGKACGAYGRLAKKRLIDYRAKEAPVFIHDNL